MPTLCRAFPTADDAHAAVARLLAAGTPVADVRVLMGAPARDARDAPVGRFGGTAAAPTEAVGAFAGAPASRRAAMGDFAGAAGDRRRGGFGDLDRETQTTYRDGVAHLDVTSHRDVTHALLEAGLDEAAAAADLDALHRGRTLVLIRTGAPEAAAAALDVTP
jgi:hypothetical protein